MWLCEEVLQYCITREKQRADRERAEASDVAIRTANRETRSKSKKRRRK
jgi:hypothetical protein